MPRGPAYRIVTARLVLRPWEPRDAPLLKAAIDANLEHLAALPWSKQEPQPLAHKTAQLRRFRGMFDLDQDYVYAIFDAAEREVLGSTGLHTRAGAGAREIGYWVHRAHTGRGLATEAAGALTRVGFEVDEVERIEIHCAPGNAPSAAVARKLGYTHEATLRGRHRDADGKPRDTMFWSLFAADYPASPAARLPVEAYDAGGTRVL